MNRAVPGVIFDSIDLYSDTHNRTTWISFWIQRGTLLVWTQTEHVFKISQLLDTPGHIIVE